MALGVHRDGIVGAAVAHIVVIGPLVLPSYLFVLKRATGVHFTALGKAVLPPLLAASVAALAARVTAAQFAIPLVQLVTGLAAGGPGLRGCGRPARSGVAQSGAGGEAACAAALPLLRRAARLARLPVAASLSAAAAAASTGRAALPAPGGTGQRPRRHRFSWTERFRFRWPERSRFRWPARVRAPAMVGETRSRTGSPGCCVPQAQVVPFWPRPELGELRGWCRAPGHVAVRLVTGEGGAGKTRLATRARPGYGGRRMAGAVGAARRRAAEPSARPGGSRGRQSCWLIDAETRTGVLRLLTDVAADVGGPDLRVMLLARSAGEWWHELINSAGNRVGGTARRRAAAPAGAACPRNHPG